MSIQLSDNIRVGQRLPLESKYFNGTIPYTNVAQAETLILTGLRHQGLTVNIAGVEYWFKDGIADGQLVIKGGTGSGTVQSIATSSPLTGGTITVNGTIGIQQANGSQNGYLSSGDWTTFNGKQNAITTGTTAQYFRGDLSLATFPTIPAAQIQSDWNQTNNTLLDFIKNKPTIPTVGTWGALNYPTWTTGTPFVKMDAAGSFILDTTVYQPLLTNPVTGTGTTNYVPKWSSSSALTDSSIIDNGTSVGIGTNIPSAVNKLQVAGTIASTSGINLDTNAAIKTGIYAGSNTMVFWAGNAPLATYRLNGNILGSYFEHTAGFTNSGSIPSGSQNTWRLAGSVTATTATNAIDVTQLMIDPGYAQSTFGTGILRGVYYNPSGSIGTSKHIAFENTKGDNYLNSTSGNTLIGYSTAPLIVYKLDVNGEINTNNGIRIGNNGAQTGLYGGANILDTWAGNAKIATWGLALAGGTIYDHFHSWVLGATATGESKSFRISSSITSNGANSANVTQLLIDPTYNQLTFGTGILRGIYYNPTLSVLNGSPHIAYHNTSGDIIHGNLSGAGNRMVIADANGKLGTQTIPSGGSSPLTTKGDLYTFSTLDARLGVGTPGQLLTVDPAEETGLKWVTFSGGGGARIILTANADTTVASAAGTDYVYLVTGAYIITLPTPSATITNSYTIKRTGAGQVTITTPSGVIEGGGASITINVQNVSLTLVTNGTNWFII